MRDTLRQLLVVVAGMVDTLAAWHLAGPWSVLVVAGAGGWCAAQYDPGYIRAKTAERPGPDRSQNRAVC